jgi:hypothetical protein
VVVKSFKKRFVVTKKKGRPLAIRIRGFFSRACGFTFWGAKCLKKGYFDRIFYVSFTFVNMPLTQS